MNHKERSDNIMSEFLMKLKVDFAFIRVYEQLQIIS